MGVRTLGKADNRDQRDDKQTDAEKSSSAAGRSCVCLLIVRLDREEVVAMPHGLDEHERAVQHQRYKPGKNELRPAIERAKCACRVVWKNQSEAGERSQHRERCARALDLKSLLMIAGAAHEQTEADDAVAHDHDGSENRVACQPCGFGRRRNHDRNNQCRLDNCYGQGKYKRAVGLSDAVCNHLRVVHGREYGPQQDEARDRGHKSLAVEKERHQ